MAGAIEVRALARSDRDPWLRLWDGYNVFYGRTGANALAGEVTQSTWERFFDAAEPMHALVAARAGSLLGFTHYLFHRSTIQLTPVCYLEDLYTAPDARGQGVASALVTAVYERARAAGVRSVYWQTHESNAVAMRLYDKLAARLGFIVYDKVL